MTKFSTGVLCRRFETKLERHLALLGSMLSDWDLFLIDVRVAPVENQLGLVLNECYWCGFNSDFQPDFQLGLKMNEIRVDLVLSVET